MLVLKLNESGKKNFGCYEQLNVTFAESLFRVVIWKKFIGFDQKGTNRKIMCIKITANFYVSSKITFDEIYT